MAASSAPMSEDRGQSHVRFVGLCLRNGEDGSSGRACIDMHAARPVARASRAEATWASENGCSLRLLPGLDGRLGGRGTARARSVNNPWRRCEPWRRSIPRASSTGDCLSSTVSIASSTPACGPRSPPPRTLPQLPPSVPGPPRTLWGLGSGAHPRSEKQAPQASQALCICGSSAP